MTDSGRGPAEQLVSCDLLAQQRGCYSRQSGSRHHAFVEYARYRRVLEKELAKASGVEFLRLPLRSHYKQLGDVRYSW